jgi:hypothetical protein
MIRAALALAFAFAAPVAGQQIEIFPRDEEAPRAMIETPGPRAARGTGAVLRGLDKISGEVEDVTLPNGGQVSLGRLEIALRECRYPAGNPAGDAWAYLAIREAGRTEAIFSGWMVASSPALNALDHARYDVWVLRCSTS